MVTDKNGNELKIGDEIFIRGRVMGTPLDLQDDGRGVVQVQWVGGSPLLGYVESKVIEKAPTSDSSGFVEE
jgi:hypothetical protein